MGVERVGEEKVVMTEPVLAEVVVAGVCLAKQFTSTYSQSSPLKVC